MSSHPFLQQFASLFPEAGTESHASYLKPVLATVKLLPLPGSIGFRNMEQLAEVIARAEQEATALASGGVHGLILENSLDQLLPQAASLERLDAAAIVLMGQIAKRIQQLTGLPVGISVLPNDPQTAFAIAAVNGSPMLRIPLAVGAKVSSDGFLHGKLFSLLAYQQQLGIREQPFYLVDLSVHHILPGDVAASLPESFQNVAAGFNLPELTPPVQHLLKLARYIESQCPSDILGRLVFIVSDAELSNDEIARLSELLAIPVVVCNQKIDTRQGELSSLYQLSAGLLLEVGIRKEPTSNRLPTVDMVKVEALMNQLQSIKSIADIQAMNPDFFVGDKPGH